MAIKTNIIFLYFFLFSINKLLSQSSLNYQQVEAKTYQYYLNEQWDSIIYIADKALKQQIDYYYLRLRTGLAFYKKEKYTKAIKHLKHAYELNSSDPILLELLYYSYLFSNQLSEANFFLKTHSSLLEHLHKKNNWLKMIYFESGISSMLNNNNLMLEKQNHNNTNLQWLESNKIDKIRYTALGSLFSTNKSILTSFSYGNINLNNKKEIWIGNDILDDHYALHQHQIYLNSIFRLSQGKYLIPAVNMIIVNYETLFSHYNKSEHKVYLNRNYKGIYDYATSIAFKIRNSKTEFDISTTFSKLNQTNLLIINSTNTYYPKGNLNFYISTSVSVQLYNKTNNFIFDEKIGLKLFKRLWIEQFSTIGKISNYVEQNSYIIHNTLDICNFRTGMQFILPIHKFRISARYLFALKSSPFQYFDTKLKTNNTNYIENNILVNLSWWF